MDRITSLIFALDYLATQSVIGKGIVPHTSSTDIQVVKLDQSLSPSDLYQSTVLDTLSASQRTTGLNRSFWMKGLAEESDELNRDTTTKHLQSVCRPRATLSSRIVF
jgi:hypothetical protein